MDFEELKSKFAAAIDTFLERDRQLLGMGVGEWAVAHRIAVYLEKTLKSRDVDCEYNRVGWGGNKMEDTEGAYKRPDISVHHRGMVEKEHNLLAIEVKIRNTPEYYGNTPAYRKLRDLTSPPSGNRPFQYQYGLAISFVPRLVTKWFPEQTR